MDEQNTQVGIWKYLPSKWREPLIVIKGKLLLAGSSKWSDSVDFIVDTGFDGEILLTNDLFILAKFDKFTLPQEYWSIGESITGETFEMPISQTLLDLNGVRYPINVETSTLIEANLVGRGFLNKFRTVLDGNNLKLILHDLLSIKS